MNNVSPQYIYKALRVEEWLRLEREGRFAGSPDDRRDGFIHLSRWEQLAETLRRHFSHPDDREVVVAAIRAADISPRLRWETSRGGELFPHLYGELSGAHVASTLRIARGEDGRYRLPAEVSP